MQLLAIIFLLISSTSLITASQVPAQPERNRMNLLWQHIRIITTKCAKLFHVKYPHSQLANFRQYTQLPISLSTEKFNSTNISNNDRFLQSMRELVVLHELIDSLLHLDTISSTTCPDVKAFIEIRCEL